MATKKINYKDKAPLQTKPEIPEENKVNAEDLNQIKEVVNNNADEIELRQLKEEGKGLSENDFTDELKAKLEGLNNYNDTEIKKEISEINKKVAENTENDIKQDNEIETLKTNYTKLQEQNTKLENQMKKDRENMIKLEVEGQSIHIEDSSDLEGKLEVLGNVGQQTNLYTGKLEQGTITEKGEVSTANRVRTANFIQVTAGIKIPVRATGADKFAFVTYDNNKKFTSIIGVWTNIGESIVIPSNVNYIKIILGKNDDSNIAISNVTNFVVGNLPSPEYPSEIRVVGGNINLFDKDNVVEGYFVSSAIVANKDWCYSVLQGIKPKEKITTSGGRCILSYFNGDTNISYQDITDKTITIPNNITKVYVSTLKTNLNTLKVEKGTVATSYSPYGQGSLEIKKQNKNIMPINTEFYELTSNGIKIKSNSMTNKITEFKIKKGQKVEIALKLITKTSTSTSFTFHTNGVGNQELGFININNYNLNQIYKKTYIATEDTVIDCALWGNEKKEIFEFQFWVEMNNVTEYEEHQEQTKILPVQKPMLTGDYFVKETDGCKEIHNWGKVILDGIKNKFILKHNTIQTSTNGFYKFELTEKLKGENGNTNNGVCNYLKYIGEEIANKAVSEIGLWWEGSGIANYASLPFLTLDEANKWLQEKNNEGNPVSICYKLENSTKLPCTPEQTEILEQLDKLPTYKPVTNITTDSIAKLKLKYIADTKTYVDNKYNGLAQQILNLAGGNNNV